MKAENLIINGMTQDVDVHLQPKNSFRDSLNGIIYTNEDKALGWENRKGNERLTVTNIDDLYDEDSFKILGIFGVTGSEMIMFIQGETLAGPKTNDRIYRIQLSDDKLSAEMKCIYSGELSFDYNYPMRNCFLYKETDSIQRIYFNDYNNQPRACDYTLDSRYVLSGSLTSGQKYFVAEGQVTHGASTYKAGEWFTASGAAYTGTGKVIEQISEDLLNFTPNTVLDEPYYIDTIDLKEAASISGSLKGGTYFYTVRLGRWDGFASHWSKLSNGVQVGDITHGNANNYQDSTGVDVNTNSGMGVQLTVGTFEANKWDFVEVAAFYSNGFGINEDGFIIAKESLSSTDTEKNIYHYGSEALGSILLNEVFNVPVTILKAANMVECRKYNILANIEERQEFNDSNSLTASLACEVYEIPVDNMEHPGTGTSGKNAVYGLDHSTTILYPNQWYKAENNLTVHRLQSLIDLANELRTDFGIAGGHAADGTYHTTGTSTPVSAIAATDLASLQTLTADLITTWNAHIADAVLVSGWAWHNAQGTDYGVGALPSATLKNIHDALTALKTAFANHLADTTPHNGGTDGRSITESGSQQSYSAGEFFKSGLEYTVSTGGSATPFIHIKKYYDLNAGANVYKDISLDGEWCNYKGEKVANYLGGWPGDEQIRVGCLCYDLQGKPYFVRHIGDITLPERRHGQQDTNTYNGRSPVTCELTKGYEAQGSGTDTWYKYWNAKIMSIIVNGLTFSSDEISKISGFSIVVAPIERQTIASGALIGCVHNQDSGSGTDDPLDIRMQIGAYNSGFSAHEPRQYVFFSPEYQFDLFDPEFSAATKLEVQEYFKAERQIPTSGSLASPHEKLGIQATTGSPNAYQKFYIPTSNTLSPGTNGTVGNKHGIDYHFELTYMAGIDGSSTPCNPNNPTQVYKHTPILDDVATTGKRYFGRGTKAVFFYLDTYVNDSNFASAVGYYSSKASTDHSLTYCRIREDKTGLYGGTSDAAKASTLYRSVGHYQEINDAVKTAVASGGNYVFNDIQIFGGDVFINIIGNTVAMLDEDIDDEAAWTIYYPVESRVNVDMRQGKHHGRYRDLYSAGAYLDGVGYDNGLSGTSINPEEFDYNPAYSTKYLNVFYPAYPLNPSFSSQLPYRNRYSGYQGKKIPGEQIDSFRIFLPDNYRDVNPRYGELVKAEVSFDKYIYFQKDTYGYIPIDERALLPNTLGQPIDVGTGLEFYRYDQFIENIGLQNFFALTKTRFGLCWFDYRRREFIHLKGKLAIGSESLIAGMHDFFNNDIADDLEDENQPIYGKAISCHYLPKTEEVYLAFREGSNDYSTKIYNAAIKKFTGGISSKIGFSSVVGKEMLSFPFGVFPSFELINHKEFSGDLQEFYGEAFDAYLHIVVNDNFQFEKIFDLQKLIGNDNMFSETRFRNSYQDVTESVINSSNEKINKFYKFEKRNWKWNIPRVSRSRMRSDGYLELILTVDKERDDIVRFVSLITDYRIEK